MTYENLKQNQANVIRLLDSSYRMGRLAQVYLFSGARGTGKMEAAKYLASLILCENGGGCGMCKECLTIKNDKNSNVHILSFENETIKKDQILELEDIFMLTSDRPQIFIIDGVDKISSRGASSLLKFLEELKSGNYGILLTNDLATVLPTIKSRCEIVHFLPIKKEIVVNSLVDAGVEKGIAKVIATLTSNIDQAIEMANDDKYINLIHLAQDFCISLDKGDDLVSLFYQNAKMLLDDNNLETHNMFFELLVGFLNDEIKKLSNKDIKEDDLTFNSVLGLDINLELDEVIKNLEKVLNYKSRLVNNINKQLLYSSLCIDLAR